MPQSISTTDGSVIHPTSLNTLSRRQLQQGQQPHIEQAKAYGTCLSGAEWRQLYTLLCAVVQALGPPGDEGLAFVRR
jgi:hypothetical protein